MLDIASLDLASLVASRVCHDIISPVGAITNGLEVLDEETDEGMRTFAMDLVRKSAVQASAKLQFARLAFGASGSAGAAIDLTAAHEVAALYFDHEKANLDWKAEPAVLPKNEVKLLLNLALLAAGSVPRGGTVTVDMVHDDDDKVIRLTAAGTKARFPLGARSTIVDRVMPNPLDAHAVQPLYTLMLADSCGMTITVAEEDEQVIIGARKSG